MGTGSAGACPLSRANGDRHVAALRASPRSPAEKPGHTALQKQFLVVRAHTAVRNWASADRTALTRRVVFRLRGEPCDFHKPGRKNMIRNSMPIVARVALVAAALLCAPGCPQDAAGPGQTPAASAGQTATACQFAIEGMSCQGCVDTVTEALTKVPGVQSAKVSLADKKAQVVADLSQASAQKIEAAVAQAGYKAQLIAPGKDQPVK